MVELWDGYLFPGIIIVGQILLVLVPLLLAVAYLTYAERRVIAAMQLRKGPNVVGPFGLLQPIADAVKLFFKETILPSGANKIVFAGVAGEDAGADRHLLAGRLRRHHVRLVVELEIPLPRRPALGSANGFL